MRTSRLAGLAAVVTLGGALVAPAAPAHADTTVLYVNNLVPEACSDTGDGIDQAFCTIGAAVAKVRPGQTVKIDGGPYAERVTVAASGTAEQPITILGGRSATGGTVTLTGPSAGVVIHHQHHVTVSGLAVNGALEAPAVDVHDASGIVLDGVSVSATAASAQPAFRLAAVTGSSVRRVVASGRQLTTGLSLDTASSGVTITAARFTNSHADAGEGVGIDVASAGTTIVASTVVGFRGAAIAVRPGAADTVIANNQIGHGYGDGVQIRGATGTALSNNMVSARCRDGVRVDGSPDRVSIQNNVVIRSGSLNGTSLCAAAPAGGVEIGVYGEARGNTIVDYNNTGNVLGYAWDQPMDLAAFRAASGQAANDIHDSNYASRIDAANSAAPAFPAEDFYGRGRGDDPSRANTGAGPIPWADRGPWETLAAPVVTATVTQEPGTGWVTVDAAATRPGFTPVASYRFDFGDGTVVTQAGAVARHRYTTHGTRTVSVRATLVDTMTATTSYQVSYLPRAGTIGLLALAHPRYVGVTSGSHPSPALFANRPTLTATEAFDLVDLGTGQVALFAHHTGSYVTLDRVGIDVVSAGSPGVGPNETFAMTRYPDGSFSLQASNGRYVSVSSSNLGLSTSATTVGVWEKFHRVNLADANRSLQPAVLRRFVTADTAATKPLAATSVTLGTNQRYDLVDLGNGRVALFAHANNRFVLAPNAGALPLVNSSGTVSPWGTFTMVRNTDGTVSFKATVNNRYVTAGVTGSSPLTASRTTIGRSERFFLR